MAEVENLEWEVSKDKEWIIVNPVSGVGNTQVNITVQPSDIVGETDTAGTVTFICKSCSPQLIKQVSVTRCAPTQCVPESRSIVYADTAVTANACDTNISVSLRYAETTKYRGGAAVNCPDNITYGNVTPSFIIPINETNTPVTHTRYYPDINTQGHATITISQGAGPCNCVDYDVSASTTSLSCGGGNISFKAVRGSSPDRIVRDVVDGYTCINFDKYERLKKQYSYDGVTWIDEGSFSTGSVLERNSADCGYTPPTPPTPPTPGEYKAKIVVNNTTYTVDCNDSTVLTYNEVKSACPEYSSMTSVEIGSCVTEIGNGAFSGCSNLERLVIPDGVETINYRAFDNCKNLTSLSIGSGTISINYDAFDRCESLKYITVDANNPKFNSSNNCNAIIETETNTLIHGSETTIIPNNVTKIGEHAFEFLKNLTSIRIPNSVTSIGYGAFYFCKGLTSVTIPDSVTSINENVFAYCDGLTSVAIPNSVTTIGKKAFSHCTSLTSVTIPSSVTRICDSAFEVCNLENINIPNTVKYLEPSVFANCANLKTVTIGTGVTRIDSSTFQDCRSLTSVTIPDSVTYIGNYAFFKCSDLRSIAIPNRVTYIGTCTFQGCLSLTSVRIPDSVTTIGNQAFYKCSGLTSVTIGNSVTSIGQGAFQNCNSLTSVTIPDSVINIKKNMFYECSNLKTVTIGTGVTEIAEYAFYKCSSLIRITIPENVTKISYWVFEDCSSLESLIVESTTPPSLSSNNFLEGTNCLIYVPRESVETYKNKYHWSTYSDRIMPIE